MKKNPVVHFEMPFKDSKRVSEFYTKIFGWGMQEFPDMGNYVVATTTETGDHGPKEPGAINGGFYPATSSEAKYPSFVIEVEDVKAKAEEVKKAGGKLFGEVTDIPGVGWFVSFEDTEGNRVSLMQPHEHK